MEAVLANNQSPKFVAEIHNVREVTLFGAADLAYWRERLAREELYPTAIDGAARLLLSATQLKFMGVRFREFIFGVSVSHDPAGAKEDGLFLLQAFNTFGPFAWVERVCFSTPYARGEVQVNVGPPASMRGLSAGCGLVQAVMGPQTFERGPMNSGFVSWQGPIYLPRRKSSEPGKYFMARLEGETQLYAFGTQDNVSLAATTSSSVIEAFTESRFMPQQWSLREQAFHAKGKTVVRRSA